MAEPDGGRPSDRDAAAAIRLLQAMTTHLERCPHAAHPEVCMAAVQDQARRVLRLLGAEGAPDG